MYSEALIETGFIGANIDAGTKEAAMRELAKLFFENGFTKDSYMDAILAREEVFPTGLPTETFGVAIPHTDAIHVIRPGIAIGVLKHPVKFGMMGYPGETVDAKLMFMLAIQDPEMQIQLLQDLIELFSDAKLMTDLVAATDPAQLVRLVKCYFGKLSTS
ncbi:hypothetical protein P22_1007 [Propionispora sp. 2/2-37]|uniref:PTS sugar transporter subunit IIA n=1 Tax=Propionispora sp. 2/2-37 TaxID=1677858 RepID=UPI0006C64C24|nr:PTS sugar transporter subunit IIA [Propionispora sp. 2/2-37]CUH94938.1 hypothetical protein P22_1007 [Propionispora sp. 2/2-37]